MNPLVPAVLDRRPPPSDRARGPIVAPLLIALAGAILLFVQWRWGRMLWLDEEMIAINIRDRTFAQLAGKLSLEQAAPYGWLVLERTMLLLFGPTERALRFVPFAFGAALLGVAVWVGRRWMNVVGASTLVFLCAAGEWVSFHALELKHYSADTCFGLLLPALAVWAVERDRVLTWWIVAALAQWFANGALFVAPVCALVLVGGRAFRPALPVAQGFIPAIGPVIWVASFSLNYVVTLGPARSSEFLQKYWAIAFPPVDSGVFGALAWLAAQFAPFATKPAGSGFGLMLWLIAAAGFVMARQPITFRVAFALVPLSAFLWSAIRLVPMFERLSLWIVPALYVGVALALERAIDAVGSPRDEMPWIRRAAGLPAALLLAALVADVGRRGTTYVALVEPEANHEVDDRGAVRWLARQWKPGDLWVTTRNALPAIWWYGGAARDEPAVDAIVESDAGACGDREIGDWMRRNGHTRALVYLGFGHSSPSVFDDVLLARLGTIGRLTGYSLFGLDGHALVFDLQQPPIGPVTLASLAMRPDATKGRPSQGCIAVSPASRW